MGNRWRKSLLGTEAIYEVVEVGERTVTVSVVEALGLRAGTRLKFSPDAFRAMERLGAPEPRRSGDGVSR